MELDNSEAGKAARKAYRCAHNLCGYCGKPGHKVVACPTLLARKNPHLSNIEAVDNNASSQILRNATFF
ncbi:hypothetical protein GcM1_201043 [Golovinomyces cichoracearum]|uniref:CCHC-type domain-containing protein n=1 Tax=Golovinomyces cichoracearum TaxID=62708 RepID=A0A420IYF5_9PEZI|nr:hypothetical protein GcM1_201043 [Golovinomyces cichoracearum]